MATRSTLGQRLENAIAFPTSARTKRYWFARFQTAQYQTIRGLSPPVRPWNGAPYFFGASAFAIAAGFAAIAAAGACAAAAGAEIAAAFAAASFAFASISAPFGAS